MLFVSGVTIEKSNVNLTCLEIVYSYSVEAFRIFCLYIPKFHYNVSRTEFFLNTPAVTPGILCKPFQTEVVHLFNILRNISTSFSKISSSAYLVFSLWLLLSGSWHLYFYCHTSFIPNFLLIPHSFLLGGFLNLIFQLTHCLSAVTVLLFIPSLVFFVSIILLFTLNISSCFFTILYSYFMLLISSLVSLSIFIKLILNYWLSIYYNSSKDVLSHLLFSFKIVVLLRLFWPVSSCSPQNSNYSIWKWVWGKDCCSDPRPCQPCEHKKEWGEPWVLSTRTTGNHTCFLSRHQAASQVKPWISDPMEKQHWAEVVSLETRGYEGGVIEDKCRSLVSGQWFSQLPQQGLCSSLIVPPWTPAQDLWAIFKDQGSKQRCPKATGWGQSKWKLK